MAEPVVCSVMDFQALTRIANLAGVTVPPAVSIAYGCLAKVFLCLTIGLAYTTSAECLQAERGSSSPDRAGLRPASSAVVGLAALQLLLGATMRHLGAGLAIPDFPLVFGGILPPLLTVPVAIHFLHRLGGFAVLAGSVWLLLRARGLGEARFLRLAEVFLALVALQVFLGAATIWSAKEPLTTTLHVAGGAAV